MNSFVLRNGQVIDPLNNINDVLDIEVVDGKISRIEKSIVSNYKTIDASGNLVTPGFVEIHAHFREPGFTHKEDLRTGSIAALQGGYTTVCVMPNTNPVIDSPYLVEYIKLRSKDIDLINIEVIAAVTKSLGGNELADLVALKQSGSIAYSDDGMPIMNPKMMRNALEYIKPLGLPIILHEEDHNLSLPGAMNEGSVSTKLGLSGTPGLAEEVMIARDILLSEKTDSPIHIAHVSTKKSVELIRQAKKDGVLITCEVTPHHLLLTDEALLDRPYDTNLKMSPPLRTREDVLECVKGINDGTIDAIATDHAPHTIKEKDQEFSNAPNGIIGLETAFSVLYSGLVKNELLSLHTLVSKLTCEPAKVFNLNKGSLSIGQAADITIINLHKEYELKYHHLGSKSSNSPWLNQKLKAKVERVFVNGITKYLEENYE
jgi:dihydroorotase